jgi:two-component system response regulator (stage 0 sporulation protein A)
MTMRSIKMLIAEDNRELNQNLCEIFGAVEYIESIYTAYNGLECLDLLHNRSPHILLLDLIMTGLDGLGVLKFLSANPVYKPPVIIVLSAISHAGVTRQAMELGADYYMVKPFDPEILVTRVKDLASRRLIQDKQCACILPAKPVVKEQKARDKQYLLDQLINRLLNESGIPENSMGYKFLKTGITALVKNGELMRKMPKELHLVIAHEYNTTPERVERAICHAIEAGLNGKDPEIRRIVTKEGKEKCVVNDFIIRVANIVSHYNVEMLS